LQNVDVVFYDLNLVFVPKELNAAQSIIKSVNLRRTNQSTTSALKGGAKRAGRKEYDSLFRNWHSTL